MKTDDRLLDESDNYFVPFTKAKWTHDELMGRKVDFRWTHQGRIVESNDGRFLIREIEGKGLAIKITVLRFESSLGQWKDYHFALNQHHVDQIKEHPDWNSDDPRSPKYRMVA